MIKRPFVWICISFILGIVSYTYVSLAIIRYLIILFFYILLFFIYKMLIKLYGNHAKQDIFLFVLPLFMIFGSYIVANQQKQNILSLKDEDAVLVEIKGEICNLIDKPKYQEVYLKEVQVCMQTTQNQMFYIPELLVKDSEFIDLMISEKVQLQGKLSVFSSPTNPGEYDEKGFYEAKNIFYYLKDSKFISIEQCRNPIYLMIHKLKKKMKSTLKTVLEENDASIMSAMILGDKSELSPDVKSLYQKAGISHILAISGLHISMIGVLFFSILKKMGLHHTVATLIAVVFIYLYGILTCFSVSTNRAVIMMIMALVGNLFGKTYDSITAIAFSAFLILLQQPMQLFQCGFLLSYLAVIGAVVFYPACKEYVMFCFKSYTARMELRSKMEIHSVEIYLYQYGKKVGNSLLVSCAIQFVTLPIIFWFYFETPIFAPIINLFILPLTSFLMILGLLIASVGSICLGMGALCSGGVHYILKFYETICEVFECIPNGIYIAGMPSPLQVFLVYLMLAGFVWAVKKHPTKYWGVLLLVAFFALIYRRNVSGIEVNMLDVGQGDGICIQTTYGKTIFVDGGSSSVSKVGKYRIIPFLKSKGIGSLDCCFLTHMDSDHINGMREIIENVGKPGGIHIKELVLPYTNAVDETYEEVVESAKNVGIDVRYMNRGDVLTYQAFQIKCLHPSIDFIAESKNAYSLVLEVSYGAFRMLLTGDVEEDGEEKMIDADDFSFSNYDVLKLAHHGSKYSNSEAFLDRTQPKVVLISAGKHNRYGHPHKETIERITERNIEPFYTAEKGAIEISVKREKWYITQFCENSSD